MKMANLDTKKKYGVLNILSMLCYIAALLGVVYVTNELVKELKQYSQQTDIMFRLKSLFDWGADMGMIFTAYGMTLLFDAIFSAYTIRCAIQKRKSMIAIIGGGIVLIIAEMGTNYITRLGF